VVNIANVNVSFFLSYTHMYLNVQFTLKFKIFSHTYFYLLVYYADYKNLCKYHDRLYT